MGIDKHPHADDFHYLRTHLTVITGYTQFARQAVLRIDDPPASIVTYLETVLTHIEQLTMLVIEMEAREHPNETGETHE